MTKKRAGAIPLKATDGNEIVIRKAAGHRSFPNLDCQEVVEDVQAHNGGKVTKEIFTRVWRGFVTMSHHDKPKWAKDEKVQQINLLQP